MAYATKYALQSERDCIAQRLDVAEPLQELADAVPLVNRHALSLVDPFPRSLSWHDGIFS